MKKNNIILTMLLLMSTLFITSCATNQFEGDPLETVESLDLERYLGRWYEIARFQSGFEKNIYGATAEYSLRKDGRIQVINSGFKNNLDGKYTQVKAVAWREDDNVPGALKVKFFSLFKSDYLVFGIDEENYEWALVGNNNRSFIWFLSRTPEISDETLEMMKDIAIEQGYDLTDLFFVPQKERE
jgi:lipocalin